VEYPVTLSVPDSDDVLVLSDYVSAQPGVGNLARVRPDGAEVWRVAPDSFSQDAWTLVRVEGNACRASTWSGWDVQLDLATWGERGRTFTK
jgi:hypothetical protein